MPRGNAEVTDQVLYKRIQKFDRPISIKDLVMRLKWSRGKIDGAIGRLAEKDLIAIVNISVPRGHRQRYLGIPGKDYWGSFYHHFFIEKHSILLYDTLGVIQEYKERNIDSSFKNDLSNIENEFSSFDIDFSILELLKSKLNHLKPLAESLNTTSTQLLIDRLDDMLHPNYDILMETGLIIANQASSENETERAVALSYLKRASAQLADQ